MATSTAGGVAQTGARAASVRCAVIGLVTAAVVAAVIPLAVLPIPDALAWSLPGQYAGVGPAALGSLLRAAGLALPAMAVAAPFGALAARRFRAGPVLLAGLLAIAAADVLGGDARTLLLIGVDRTLRGLGAGICLAAAAAIAAERNRAARALGGWWAAVMVSGLAAAPELMRQRVSSGGWYAALQPYPWLTGAALALAALYAFLAENGATAAVRNAFPAADRAHLALLAAPVAGLCAISVAVTYRGDRAVVAAALAEAVALAALAGMTARARAARLAVVCAVTGFTLVPAASTVAALARPSPLTGSAVVAAALAGAALAARIGSASRVPVRGLTAVGLLAAAMGFGTASLTGSAVAQPVVLALLCVPVAGGLATALAGALHATSAGGAACGLVLLVTGVVAGCLASGAVQLQALGQARTVAAVHAALISTSIRWALIAAAVSATAALALACTPLAAHGRKSS